MCAGSYSYVAVGSSAKTYDDLAAPVRRRVLFAGAPPMPLHPCTGCVMPDQSTSSSANIKASS